ncbi:MULTISPECIES: ATP-binding domain-containing protein [Niastella]|uniref:ATP-binding domain-containing protein n=1 Tax=Niastella soli TaxID=2821487 RepID=A0ABS3YTZ9_9BACT|nr:ATP-binding domain-containing protein [Niastella soli]MBO9201042.1 ATP-binding domain-containing protein [Niastella soli]
MEPFLLAFSVGFISASWRTRFQLPIPLQEKVSRKWSLFYWHLALDSYPPVGGRTGLRPPTGGSTPDPATRKGFTKVEPFLLALSVGDPGQLPPVKQTFSPALELEWLATHGRTAIALTLEKIERTDAGNGILALASVIRNMVEKNHLTRYPKLPASNLNNVCLYDLDEELFKKYLIKFKELGANGTIAIARSNRMVNDINAAVRRDLFGALGLPIRNDDVLLVTHNNHAVALTNGDFVIVSKVGEIEIKAGLHFQKIYIKALLSETEHEILISLDILYGSETNYTKEQSKSLMLDFSKRMKQKNIKVNSDEYKNKMMTDSYLNCLRAKFGYAVTCHKAQGGEWNEVFLFLEKSMYAMDHAELFRWWYTAVTRARKNLHLTNQWWIG